MAVLASASRGPHAGGVAAIPPRILDKVMAELVAVSASATSKREEAANLARIWGQREDPPAGRHRKAESA